MQPDSHNDLDQTDELPQLDVAAYEASLAPAGEDPLSRTDTWAVEALRSGFQGLEQAAQRDEAVVDLPTRIRSQKPVISGSADLTVNIDGLVKRITELETGSAAAAAANVELEQRCLSLSSERTELEQGLQALQGENAQLNETETAREADRLSMQQAREVLERQLEQKAKRIAEQEAQHATLQDQLSDSIELAASRAATIAELQQSLAEEENAAHGLGRNLAVKLADCENLSSMVMQRNATILSLERRRDELDRQLQQATANCEAFTLQLADANARVARTDEQASEWGSVIEQRDQQLTALRTQVERLTGELQAAAHERDSSRHALALEKEQQDRVQLVLAARTQEIAALRQSLDDAESIIVTLQADLETALAVGDELAAKTAELNTTATELISVRHEAAQIRTELEAQSALAHTREQELAAARQIAADLHGARDDLQRALAEATDKMDRLHAVSRDDTQLLTAKSTELAELTQRLEEQQPLIHRMELSIRARDKLVEDLRNEVRTVQNERAIMAGQIDKARLRIKSMAQQIFQKDTRIATLKADLAVHTEALAAIRRDVSRIESGADELTDDHLERVLEPVDHEGEIIVLNRRVMTIGRTNDNDIFIPSKMISRQHARLLVGPNAVIVEDAGSTNGCYVNDQPVKQHVLREGDVLAIGDLKFRLGSRAPNDTRMRANVIAFNDGRRNNE